MVDAARAIGPEVAMVAESARWYGHDDDILDIEFSPDGQLVASADRDHATRLWGVVTGEQVARLHTPYRSRGIAFSPDGRIVASIGNGAYGRLWHVDSHEEEAEFVGSGRHFPSAV